MTLLAPLLPKNSNCKTMMMARRVEMMLSRVVSRVVGRNTKDQESQIF